LSSALIAARHNHAVANLRMRVQLRHNLIRLHSKAANLDLIVDAA
jgi:hypothetical protein